MKYCPYLCRGPMQQGGLTMIPAPVSTPTSQPARGGGYSGCGHPRWGAQTSRGQARCYALPERTEVIASDTVITYIFSVYHNDASVLFDPSFTYSYVSSYFTSWLGLLRLEWKGSIGCTPSRVILFLNAQRMVDKGYLACLAFVRYLSADTPTIKSVSVVREFLNVFPADLLGMPSDKDIDFGIDLVLGMQPISIPLYRMDPVKLKELNKQLKELLDKGFVKPSVSPWSPLFESIKSRQYDDPHLLVLKDTVHRGSAKEVTISDDGTLRLQGRIWVNNVDGLGELIIEEAHSSWYSIHPGAGNMYCDLRQHY
ncbi:uncharacterized protein [Nicotiana tomentosiformis]|uniref:uncharacterized protein n=1 Tax=Nicotiana tomentosiformis TaxID=4098 RepID=UPI00388CAE2B